MNPNTPAGPGLEKSVFKSGWDAVAGLQTLRVAELKQFCNEEWLSYRPDTFSRQVYQFSLKK